MQAPRSVRQSASIRSRPSPLPQVEDALPALRLCLFMGMAQALAAVGQVQAHGSAGRFRILTGNGLVDFFVFTVQAVHVLLLVIMGGMLSGVGIYMCFRQGGSTGGTDIVALLINKYHPINYGRVVLVTDSLIICASLLVGNGIETVIYGFLLTAVFGLSTDALLAGNQQSNQILVISHEHDRIAAEIVEKAHRGVTMLNGMGWYTKESSQVVMVICRKRETADILKIVRNLDPKAFVSVASVTGVYGQGFGIIDGGMLNGMKKN